MPQQPGINVTLRGTPSQPPPTNLREYVEQMARQYNVPSDLAFDIIDKESSGVHQPAGQGVRTSGAGAQGFFQLLPSTAYGEFKLDPTDPLQNIEAGVRYLRQGLDRNAGDVKRAAMYYHGGPNEQQWGPLTQAYGDDIVGRVRARLSGAGAQRPPGPRPTMLDAATDTPSMGASRSRVGVAPPTPPRGVVDVAKDYLSEALAGFNPAAINRMVQSSFWHPLETLKGIGEAQGRLGEEALAAAKEGDVPTALARGAAYALPLIGPRLAEAGDYMKEGEYAKGLGATTDVGLQLAGPKLAKSVKVPEALKGLNPKEAAAVAWGMKNKIPLDAATVIGNIWLRRVQRMTEASPVGALVARSSRQAQEVALAGKGRDLARTGAPPTSPGQAGGSVRAGLDARIDQLNTAAGSAYDELRAIEADPKHLQTVQTGTQTTPTGILDAQGNPIMRTTPITRDVAMPIQLRSRKAALQPLLDAIHEEWPITQQQRSPALKALENFMAGPDIESASVVDRNLGRLKSLARDPNLPAATRRIAHQAIDELEIELRDTLRTADPKAEAALMRGRAATRAKYDAIDVLDELREDPVQAFDQTVWASDRGAGRLERIARQVPDAPREIGRAWVDDLIDKATSAGGFNREMALWSKWDNLGPKTKQLLFPTPGHVQALDNFFLLARKLAENPNPSGTAVTAASGMAAAGAYWMSNPMVAAWTIGGGGVIAALLNSPRGARMLAQGMRIPMGTGAALAWTEAADRLIAKEMGDKEEGSASRFAAPPSFSEAARPVRELFTPPPAPPARATGAGPRATAPPPPPR